MLTRTDFWFGVGTGVVAIYAWHWYMARKANS